MFETLLRGLFPVQCVICREDGQWLCHEHQKLPPAPPNLVRYKHLDRVWATTAYSDDNVKAIIEHLKFKHFKQLGKPLAKTIKSSLSADFWQNAVLVPIPLHWKRQLWRGFNQSELIARELGTVSTDLKRKKHTAQQARLDRKRRSNNIKNAFTWVGKKAPARIILIDDVVASGQTLDEAARILKKAGAQEVLAVVFARGG